jgi:AcrR family transcriptional regulator
VTAGKGPVRWEPAPGRSDATSVRGKRTREKILRSAIVVFGTRGFGETTVLDIAEHAGLASGTVYQYFEDKADVFRFLLQDVTDRLFRETLMPADEAGHLIVRDSLLSYLEIYREYATIFRAWWEQLEPETEFTEAWVALHDRSRRSIVAVIRDGQRRGIIDRAVQPAIAADLIVAAYERPMFSRIVQGWQPEVSDEELVLVITRLLGRGLGSSQAS